MDCLTYELEREKARVWQQFRGELHLDHLQCVEFVQLPTDEREGSPSLHPHLRGLELQHPIPLKPS
ncbi:hypothetical protein Mapa_015036 [Marchantia paleacea]|nr:hypothetical protein Mapa_015036 [Marchantia paleacea]